MHPFKANKAISLDIAPNVYLGTYTMLDRLNNERDESFNYVPTYLLNYVFIANINVSPSF